MVALFILIYLHAMGNYIKKILLFGLSVSTVLITLSQNTQPLANTLLWKISGNGLSKPSFLFGTMHILCSGDAILSDSMKEVIKQTEEVYFEIDISDMRGMMSSMKYMRMNDNKRLSDLLDSADYKKLKAYFEKHSPILPFSMLERFKPLFISSLIEEEDLDCKTTDGMEMIIMQEARIQNKKINGLETVEFQAGLFDSIPYEKQALSLMNYVDSAEDYKKMTDTLTNAYKQQDLQKIDELTSKDDPSMNDYMDLLLYARNRNWVARMRDLLPGKSLLFAVGAGHLPGELGVISLLRKKGYTVTALKN
jgi:uncharacterized protein